MSKQDHFLIWALQVAGSTAGAPNAFAQSSNHRVVINKALDLGFFDDLEAKACVVADEMAHLQQDPSQQMKKALAGWNTEAAGKIGSAVRNAHSAKSNTQFWSTLAMVANDGQHERRCRGDQQQPAARGPSASRCHHGP